MTNWRHCIKIKEYLSEDTSDSAVLIVTQKLLPQIKGIRQRDSAMVADLFWDGSFDAVIDLLETIETGVSNGVDAGVYDYALWCDVFNEALELLYDCGDTEVLSKNGVTKFLWVG